MIFLETPNTSFFSQTWAENRQSLNFAFVIFNLLKINALIIKNQAFFDKYSFFF